MHKPLVFDLPHEDATQKLAATFGEILVQGDVVYLRGPLGVGKSTFTRWVIRHLMENPDQVVPSPTFTLVQTYDTKPYPLWHFDLYRLKDPTELFELGFEEALGRGISFIEWPENLKFLTGRQLCEAEIGVLAADDPKILFAAEFILGLEEKAHHRVVDGLTRQFAPADFGFSLSEGTAGL